MRLLYFRPIMMRFHPDHRPRRRRPPSSDLLVELRDQLVHGILHTLRGRSPVRVPRRLLVVLEHVSPHQPPPGDAEVVLLLVRFVHGPGMFVIRSCVRNNFGELHGGDLQVSGFGIRGEETRNASVGRQKKGETSTIT